MEEIWKCVKGYEDYYQVSNLGRVRSLDRLVQCRNGMRMYKGRILKQGIDKQGYHLIGLTRDNKVKHLLVSRLVYSAFVGDIPDGIQVNHIDENKDNNTPNNLNLMTPKENANYGTRNERSGRKRRKKIVMDDNFEFDSITKAAKYLGCAHTNICDCCKNPTHTIYGHTFRYKQNEESKQ